MTIADVPTGIDLDPYSRDHKNGHRLEVARKAAWFSLGFMLREAAKVVLDIQSPEIRVGVRVRPLNKRTEVEIFLADQLDNGAGYATHLGKASTFIDVLSSLDAYVDDLATRERATRRARHPATSASAISTTWHTIRFWTGVSVGIWHACSAVRPLILVHGRCSSGSELNSLRTRTVVTFENSARCGAWR